MCLATRYDKPFRGSKGWKIIQKDGGRCYTGITSSAAPYRVGLYKSRYSRSNDRIIRGIPTFTDHAFEYPSGFHIFTKKKDAGRVKRILYPDLILTQVGFRGQVAYGSVHWATKRKCETDTVVAKECKLL